MSEPAKAKEPNRLVHEKSPYLLQHAYNPVDWYPWGSEAFERAQKENKLIFLSIGYATCHWCHVMAHESFENEEVARRLNASFVNVKVDREELPAVDALYMECAQALMSSPAGWPLNVILTPDLKPLFAVTYLPPAARRGLLGIVDFVDRVEKIWTSPEKGLLLEQTDKLLELFQAATKVVGDKMPPKELLDAGIEVLYEAIDTVYGGFKGEPKFPISYAMEVLLAQAKSKSESRALFCVELTLDAMQRCAIYDHLGGGFSRYAVDERWTTPHFEKMLYDNALLAHTYLEAWKFTQKESYRKTAFETLDYILRQMSQEAGGFFSAQDADAEGKEGAYYTWTEAEIRSVLPHDVAELFCHYYNVSSVGNYGNRNVLYARGPVEELVAGHGIDVSAVEEWLDGARKVLLQERQKRAAPLKDDKILTSWNGLMIDTMVRAGTSFDHPLFTAAAYKAAAFIKEHLWKEGELLHRWRSGDGRFVAGLDDYAFLIKGLLSLFEEGGASEFLHWAIELAHVAEERFKSPGGAFYNAPEDPSLILRNCDFIDGAEPSGNGVHAENLVRLYQLTWTESFLAQAEDIFKAVHPAIEMYPPGTCFHLLALQRYYDTKARTIVVALDEQKSLREEIKALLARQFLPDVALIWKTVGDEQLVRLAPWLIDKKPIDGQTTVYICTQESCEEPLLKKEDIVARLGVVG